MKRHQFALMPFHLAREVGFEPTTHRLHLPLNFFKEWTISSSPMEGCEALPIRLRRKVLSCEIVSEPSPKIGAWLLIPL
jgi:hypothetical protein